MSYDKIVDSSALDASLTAVADAIREKTGKSATMTLAEMPTEIGNISDGTDIIAALLEGTAIDLADDKATSIRAQTFGTTTNGPDYKTSLIHSIKCSNVETIYIYAFSRCTGLISADFPKCKTVGGSAFYYCSALKSVNLPELITVGISALRNTALESILLPKATTIGNFAFYQNLSLNTVDLGVATSIGASAFNKCSALFDLYLRSPTVCSLANTNAFTETPSSLLIHVPAELVDSYKTATNWSTYADQIDAI